MAYVDIETKKRNTLQTYNELLSTYKKQLTIFQDTINEKRSSNDNKEPMLVHATSVLDCVLSYKTIIEEDVGKAQKWGNEPSIETLSSHIKTMQMVLPAIAHSHALLTATTAEEINNKSIELVNYVQTTLSSNPTLNHRINGAMQILGGLLLAAAGLAVAGIYFAMAFSPLAPLVVMITFPAFGSMFGMIGSLTGAIAITSGINTFMDRDHNRDSLHNKLMAYNGMFFHQVNDEKNSMNETNKTSNQCALPHNLSI